MDKQAAFELLSKATDEAQSAPTPTAVTQPPTDQSQTNQVPGADPTNQTPMNTTPLPPPVSSPTNDLAPLTDAAAKESFNEMLAKSNLGPLRQQEQARREGYVAKNKEEGVPLDIDTGISPWEKFVLGFHRERDNQVKYLQGKYGENNVRTDSNGQLIVRVLDTDTQKAKDLKVDEWNMSAKDLLELSGSVPEVAAGVIAALGARRLPNVGALKGFLGLQRDVAATAVGAEAAGAVKDVGSSVATKGVEEGAKDVPKIAAERTAMGVGDVVLGEATMGAAAVPGALKKLAQGSRGAVQFDTIAAQKYFLDKYGKTVPLSLGESTGAPIIARTEAFMEKLPGGGSPFQKLKGQQEQALRDLQSIMMGKTPATDEAVGKATIDALMKKIAPVEEGVSQASKTLGKVGTQQIENIIGGVTLPERQIFQSETGKEIRSAVITKRDEAKAEADTLYAAVKAAPGGEGKAFDIAPLKARFKEIEDSLPSPENTVEVASPIVGPDGEPILQTETGKKVLKEFVPPNIYSRLKAISDLEPGTQFSLSDLQQMRREVYDDIAKGEGVPGLGVHYLNDMGKAITGAIDDGIAAMPEGELRTALDAANKHYKEKVIPFNRIGITELFRNPNEAGHVSDSEVISRIFSGGKAVERYNLMKETLGDTSPEFSKLKRSLADRIIEDSRIPGDTMIDPKRLVQNLRTLRTDTPEIARDMFGGKINEMFRQAKFLEYAQGAKVDADELKGLLKDKSPTVSAFKALIDSEKQRDTLYKNEIMRDVASAQLGSKPVNPSEFVNRFLYDAKPSDVKAAMYAIRGNKPLVDDLRAKTVEKVFRDASRSATPSDIGRLLSQDPTRIVTGTSVYKQIESTAARDKIRSVLGPDIYQDLEQYIRLQAGTEFKETQFKGAGGLAAGMQIANLTRRGPLRYMYEAGKDFVVAQILTRPSLREFLSSVPVNKEPQALQLMLTSAPFVEAVAKEFPGSKGAMFMSSIRNAVDKWMNIKQQGQNANDPAARRKAAEDILDKAVEPAPRTPAKPLGAIQTPSGAENAQEGGKAQRGTPSEKIVAASYTNPETGKVTTASNHVAAAKRQGVDAPEEPEARQTPEFGFKVRSKNGKTRIVPREEAERIARANGQILEEPKTGKLHSDEVAMA